MSALWNWQTCLPVGKRRPVAALHMTPHANPPRPATPFASWTAPAKRSGDGAFARTRDPRTFEHRCPHESGVPLPAALRCWTRARTAAVSQTSRSSFAGMTASEIFNPACEPNALRLIRRRAGHSRAPLQGRAILPLLRAALSMTLRATRNPPPQSSIAGMVGGRPGKGGRREVFLGLTKGDQG